MSADPGKIIPELGVFCFSWDGERWTLERETNLGEGGVAASTRNDKGGVNRFIGGRERTKKVWTHKRTIVGRRAAVGAGI